MGIKVTEWCLGGSRTAVKINKGALNPRNPYFWTGQCGFCTRTGIRVTLDGRVYRHVDQRPYAHTRRT